MPLLRDFFSPRRRLLQQQREITQLRRELEALRFQNNSMREGMRRCMTCEYRVDFKQRQVTSHREHHNATNIFQE